jgi:hypothetical protein
MDNNVNGIILNASSQNQQKSILNEAIAFASSIKEQQTQTIMCNMQFSSIYESNTSF